MKQIHLGVFEVAGPQVGGTLSWPHPLSESARFHELDHWIHMAKLLDAAGFDFLFFADGFGFPSIDGDLPEESHGRRQEEGAAACRCAPAG